MLNKTNIRTHKLIMSGGLNRRPLTNPMITCRVERPPVKGGVLSIKGQLEVPPQLRGPFMRALEVSGGTTCLTLLV